MSQIRSHRDLLVWQRAMDLVEHCYRATTHLPKSEVYGLSSQLQRAAVSVPANIAEGHGRKSTRAYLHHLSIAYGSLAELETHIEIACRLKYLVPEHSHELSAALDEADGCWPV
jgi:four helix bundle protein